NSGFSSALIRKKDCTDTDFSTVFYFNLVAGILFFFILFFSAPAIAGFFNEPQLEAIVQVLGIVLIIDSLTLIQRTILTKRIDFKLQARISVIASLGSGIVAIIMAFNGFGVWSLVAQLLLRQGLNSFFLWLWNRWRPLWIFSKQSFKELFDFGSKLMLLGIIDTLYRNVYYLIIGKFYPAENLGQYTRAENFKKLPTETLGSIIERVTYPVLSSIQDDKKKFKEVFRRLLKSSTILSFTALFGLASVSNELTIVLLGPEWKLAGEYLEILCFTAIFYPLDKILSSVLKVAGRSDLILILGIIRKIMAIPVILTAIFVGIKPMLYVLILQQLIVAILISNYSAKYAYVTPISLFKDQIPSFIVVSIMFFILKIFHRYADLPLVMLLITKIILGSIIVVVIFELIKNKDYIYLKNELIGRIKQTIEKYGS
ncbi:MAG: lipopolysaccharide biosynthesis protein, partial [Erysipelotrichia bacterium]|nr:lipopolysaccharide biosynthesis protein [Erysipelotrichia bacterium]